ncbi:MAG: hypothetical protein WCP10_03915, partial [Desulfuromonadales bacterium]
TSNSIMLHFLHLELETAVLLAKQKGYKLVNAPFGLLHNRPVEKLNLIKELAKIKLDLIGSCFTKSIEVVGIYSVFEDFYNYFQYIFRSRLTKLVVSYFRIIGLLEIINIDVESYREQFSIEQITTFIADILPIVHKDELYISFNKILSDCK